MTSFSLNPRSASPRPTSDGFPQGIQWEADGTALGDRHVQTVNLVGFGTGGVTRDEDTLTVVAPAAGGGGGGAAQAAQGMRATLQSNQSSGNDILFNDVDGFGNWAAGGGYNFLTGEYTVPAGGDGFVHAVFADVMIANGGEAGPLSNEVAILLNGSTTLALEQADIPGTGYANHFYKLNAGMVLLAAGDKLKVRATTALTTNMAAQGGPFSHFSVIRLFQP